MATSTFKLLQVGLFVGGILGLAALAGTRAAPIEVPMDAELYNGQAAQAMESQYDERFPVKNLGINVWAAIEYTLFNEGRPGLIVGEDGWLYTAEEFKTRTDAEYQIARHLALIPKMRDELAAKGSQLLIAALPSKARIYPEQRGRRQPARVHEPLYAQLRTQAQQAGIAAPDLREALELCKQSEPVFLRTDTHWTPAGARCAAAALGKAAAAARLSTPSETTIFETETLPPVKHQGDLLRYLPLDPYFASLLPSPDVLRPERTHSSSGANADLLGDTAAPQVVLVGTSYSADSRWNFAGALSQALGADVVSYANAGQGPFAPMQEYLRSEDFQSSPPRLVIWEIPERYLPIAEGTEKKKELNSDKDTAH